MSAGVMAMKMSGGKRCVALDDAFPQMERNNVHFLLETLHMLECPLVPIVARKDEWLIDLLDSHIATENTTSR